MKTEREIIQMKALIQKTRRDLMQTGIMDLELRGAEHMLHWVLMPSEEKEETP